MAKLTKEQKVGVGLGIGGLITAVVVAIKAKALEPILPTLYGLVTDVNTGEPIPSVTVDVLKFVDGIADILSTVTASDGSYSIAVIPPGPYIIRFSHIHWETVNKEITVVTGETRELNAEMLRYYYPVVNILGRVSNFETQGGIPDVLAQILGTALSTYTDPYGYYLIRDIPAGPYTLHFTHKDYTEVKRDITLGAKETEEISVSMMPLAVEKVLLGGRIMNVEGDAIPWADVFVYPPPYPAAGEIRIKADGQGYYEAAVDIFGNVIELEPGQYHIVTACPPVPRYEIGVWDGQLDYGENVVDFYLKLWAA